MPSIGSGWTPPSGVPAESNSVTANTRRSIRRESVSRGRVEMESRTLVFGRGLATQRDGGPKHERLDGDFHRGVANGNCPGRLDVARQGEILSGEVHDAARARVTRRDVNQVKTAMAVQTSGRDQQVRRVGNQPGARIFERRTALHR